MSGGVDSSVAAALLKGRGYQVIGLTMRLYDAPEGEESGCCSPEDIYDARAVADHLGIPFYVINFKAQFKRDVMEYFVNSYLSGRTPNPCVLCNAKLKFELLLRRARELQAQYLATGHYARVEFCSARGCFVLKKARDLSRDQSYFLFTMTQEQLSRCLFPLGGLTKDEVRKMAKGLGLKVADKPDSQEVCFVPGGDYAEFIRQRLNGSIPHAGEIVDRQGNILGVHQGVYAYTVGQRRGLNIGSKERYFVLGIDAGKNRVIVGKEEELYSPSLIASGVNWTSGPPEGKIMAEVRIRYRHRGAEAVITPQGDGKVKVDFSIPQKSITPGQAVVFYRGDEVLGGGWIETSL